MKVLIIEDEEQLLHNIKASLEKEDILVETAKTAMNFDKAIEKALV